MKVTIRYFAAVREAVGHPSETRDVPSTFTAGQLIDAVVASYPAVASLQRTARIMINRDYAERDRALQDGDEVALIPPVSGGSGDFRVTDRPIDMQELSERVASPRSGAVATFAGAVRDHARGRGVLVLEYEAYPEAAEKALEQIGAEIREQWDVEGVAIVHRTGRLSIGEVSVGIAVSSAHRAEAFDACRHAIERIKQIVPIWKKEFYEDGETWIGSEAEYQAAYGTSTKSPGGEPA
ncbi:MAG: molybdopterin converting factor subunit 1 [Nitrolancea sp.]